MNESIALQTSAPAVSAAMSVSADRQVADLLAVLEVSRLLGANTELQTLLETIEQAALKVLGCERATVFLHDSKTDELFSRVATGVTGIRFPADRGIAGEALRTGTVINVPDAYADARFNPQIDLQTGFRTRNMLTFPLIGLHNATVGVLQVLNKKDGAFTAWDDELVRTFGAQAGVAAQRQILLEEFAAKQRIERDLNIARSIQQGALPKQSPQVKGFDLAGWNTPADETGGDFYDFQTLPSGEIALTVADVSGHGIGPALVVAQCRALLRAILSLTTDVTHVVTTVNDLLSEDLPADRFVTAFFGLFKPAENKLLYTSAGHGPLLYYNAGEDRFTELPVHGPPLGVMAGMPYDSFEQVQLGPGDIVLVCTDGFFEWANTADEQFGLRRAEEVVRQHASGSAADLILRLRDAVLEFAEGTPQLDDLTAIALKKL